MRDLDFEHTSVYRVKLLDRGEMGTFVEKTLSKQLVYLYSIIIMCLSIKVISKLVV